MTMTMKREIQGQRNNRYSVRLMALALSAAIVTVLLAFTATTTAAKNLSEMAANEATSAYIPDEEDVEILARLLYGEARGVASEMERAAVVWCVLNRVDAEQWPDTMKGVVTQAYQFGGYSASNPVTEDLKAIAADVLARWEKEKAEGGDVGRVLPANYFYFSGDGEHNYFRADFNSKAVWNWSLENPYES